MAKKLPTAKRDKKPTIDRFARAEGSELLNTSQNAGSLPPNTQKVQISSLYENPYNERFYYSDSVVQKRAESLKTKGQIQPILVTRDPKNFSKLIVIDGHYRWKAALILEWFELEAIFIQINSPEELYGLSRDANRERQNSSIFDQASVFYKLLDDGVFKSQLELAKVEGVSETTISKILALNSIPCDIKRILATGASELKYSTAYEALMFWKDLCANPELCSSNPNEVFKAFCQKEIIHNGIGRNEIAQRRKNLKKQLNIPTPSVIPELYIHFTDKTDKKIGSFKLKGQDIVLKYSASNANDATKLAEKIKSVIKEFNCE